MAGGRGGVAGGEFQEIPEDAAGGAGVFQRGDGLLEGLNAAALPASGPGGAQDLRISDYIVDEPLGDDASFQDLLIFAAKKEAKAVVFYADLAARAADPSQRKIFEFLIGQEKSHKLRLEQEYEKYVLPEN